jgi:hypothetical protein
MHVEGIGRCECGEKVALSTGGRILRRTNQRLERLNVCSHTPIAAAAWPEVVLILCEIRKMPWLYA